MRQSIESKICVSIAEPSAALCLRSMKGLKMAEIRLDGMKIDEEDIRRIFSVPMKLVATFRPGNADEEVRLRSLMLAIECGASFVDIELDSKYIYREKIKKKARENRCKVIVSYHNYDLTPSREELWRITNSCFESGADVAKIACKVNAPEDNSRLLGLLEGNRNLVAIGMGRKGAITRVAATLLGAPFTFASSSSGRETASGQISVKKLKQLIGSIT